MEILFSELSIEYVGVTAIVVGASGTDENKMSVSHLCCRHLGLITFQEDMSFYTPSSNNIPTDNTPNSQGTYTFIS